MKNLLIALIIFFTLFGCSDNQLESEPVFTTQKRNNVYAENGVLHLPTDCVSMVDSIIALPREGRLAWEKSLGFISYNSVIEGLYDELEKAESLESYIQLVESNPDFVYFDQDSSIKETLEIDFFRSIANQNRVFYVGETKHFVRNDGVYAIAGNEEVQLSSFKHNHDYDLKCGPVEITNGVQATGDRFCSLGCVNNSGGSSDAILYTTSTTNSKRRVGLSFKMYRVSLSSDGLTHCYRLQVTLRGEAKNIWGNWKPYETSLHIRELKGKYLSYDVRWATDSHAYLPWYSLESFDYGSYDSNGDYYSKTWTWQVHVDEDQYRAPNPLAVLVDPWIDEIMIKYTTRGIGYDIIYQNQ